MYWLSALSGILALLLVMPLVTPILPGSRGIRDSLPDAEARVAAAYRRLPLSFELNTGQADAAAQFLARGLGYTLSLGPTTAVLALRPPAGDVAPPVIGEHRVPASPHTAQSATSVAAEELPLPAVVRMEIVGGNADAPASGYDPLPGNVHYFLGDDPAGWRTNIPTFGRVRYQDVYSGIDLIYYGNQRQLEYDFVLAPGADPSQILLHFDGIDALALDGAGDIVLTIGAGQIRKPRPVLYQVADDGRHEVAGHYVVADERDVRFAVGAYDPRLPLVIDPFLAYSTYFGGSGDDRGNAIAVDSAGNAYVTGFTASANLPLMGPYQGTLLGTYDAFVLKLDANGTLVYSTYIGGSGNDSGNGIAADSAGNAYVTGYTFSADFPTSAALYSNFGGVADAFALKLNATGNALVYSTYLGGNSDDYGTKVVLDGSANVYVAGYTFSPNFPTTSGVLSSAIGGTKDGFVAKLSPTGQALSYSTYLGGSGDEDIQGLAVDATGYAYVTGSTTSTNFPGTSGGFLSTSPGGTHAYVAKLDPSGNSLAYATYLYGIGGSGLDQGNALAVDTSGNAYVAGYTSSTSFPSLNPYQSSYGGGIYDVFITKLNAAGNGLVYSTYLGGNDFDIARGIAVDASGNAYVSGWTQSGNFPTVNAIQSVKNGTQDAFIAKLSPGGTSLVYSTYLGGSDQDEAALVALDTSGNAYITGRTGSANFPTANAMQGTTGGSNDVIVVKIADNPSPTPTTTSAPTGTPTTTPTVTTTATRTPTGTATTTATPSPTSTTGPSPTPGPLTVVRCGSVLLGILATCRSNGTNSVDGPGDPPRGADGDLSSEWNAFSQPSLLWQADSVLGTPVTVAQVTIWGRPQKSVNGKLAFSTGTDVPFGSLDPAGCAKTVSFSSRPTTYIRFVVEGLAQDVNTAGFRDLEAYSTAAYPDGVDCGRVPAPLPTPTPTWTLTLTPTNTRTSTLTPTSTATATPTSTATVPAAVAALVINGLFPSSVQSAKVTTASNVQVYLRDADALTGRTDLRIQFSTTSGTGGFDALRSYTHPSLVNYTFSDATPGNKTLFAQVVDAAGTPLVRAGPATIRLDPTSGPITEVIINAGALFTNSLTASLSIHAPALTAVMRVYDCNGPSAAFEPFDTVKVGFRFNSVPGPSGFETSRSLSVCSQFQLVDGTLSQAPQPQIYLHARPPVGSINLLSRPPSGPATLLVSADTNDPNGRVGVTQVEISTQPDFAGAVVQQFPPDPNLRASLTFDPGLGNLVYARFTDQANNKADASGPASIPRINVFVPEVGVPRGGVVYVSYDGLKIRDGYSLGYWLGLYAVGASDSPASERAGKPTPVQPAVGVAASGQVAFEVPIVDTLGNIVTTGYYELRLYQVAGDGTRLATSSQFQVAATTATVGPTITPQPRCDPRPNVSVQTTGTSPTTLRVTISASGARGGTVPPVSVVRLGAINVGQRLADPSNPTSPMLPGRVDNAVLDIGGQTAVGAGTRVPLDVEVQSYEFTLRRIDPSRGAYADLVVEDGCHNWATFVGGGPNAFPTPGAVGLQPPGATPTATVTPGAVRSPTPTSAPGGAGATTPTAAVPTPCASRPPVSVVTTPLGDGRLQVTLSAGTSAALPSNALRELRFAAATNALVDAGGQTGQGGAFTVTLAAGTQQTSFVIRRATAGQAATVPLVVVDACGDWPTIVGGGPSAF